MKMIPRFGAIGLSILSVAIPAVLQAPQARAQQPCAGDCNGNGAVAVNELITGVNIVLGRAQLSACPSMDVNENGTVTINELIAAVAASLGGCGSGGADFADVQAIFDEKCATVGCHSGAFPANDMSLVAGVSFDEIVGVEPFNAAAVDMGLLRVDPGDAANSFLLLKVAGPLPPVLGSQMPQFQEPLSEDEVRTIREWIETGANP
jgi:hypothetical protein